MRSALIPPTGEVSAAVLVAAGLAWFVSFSIAVMLFASPFSAQHGTISAFAFSGRDVRIGSPPRFVSDVRNAGGTGSPADGLRDALATAIRRDVLLSPWTVFSILSLASDAGERQPSVRGLLKTASAGDWNRGFLGLLGMFPWGATGTLINKGVGSELWATWGVPHDWPPATLQEMIRWDLKSSPTECLKTRCPDLTLRIGETLQKESSQTPNASSEEDSEDAAPGRTAGSPSTRAGSMEITYDPSPPSVAAPTLALFCEKRLPGTPPPFLVACDTLNDGTAGSWGVSFQYSTLEGALASDQWNLSVDIGSGLHVVVASALPDLLDEFGINQIRNSNLQTHQGLQSIGTSASQQVLKDSITPTGQFFAGITSRGSAGGYFAGITSLGPAAGFEITSGQFGGQVTAIAAGGQVQLGGTLLYQAGDLGFGYTWGTDGSGLIARWTRDPFDLAIALVSSDVQIGLSYTPHGGPTLQASWSGAKGFELALVAEFKISLGPASHGPVLEGSEPSVELPLGRGNLVLTSASPSTGPSPPSVDFQWSMPAPAQPASPPVPAAFGAKLIVRGCVVTEGKDACGPGDSMLPLKVLVDGTLTISTGEEIPISPGRHQVRVPAEAVPPLLVPVRGLKCDLTIPDLASGICDLPFRQGSGSPRKMNGPNDRREDSSK